MRIQLDASNTLIGFTESGATYRRKQDGGRYLDQYDGPNNQVWRGRYTMLERGSYWFQQENTAKRFTRNPDGTWSESAVPWTP